MKQVNTEQRPPTPKPADERRTDTDRGPAPRIIGLQIGMFWTVIIIAIVAIALILYFAL